MKKILKWSLILIILILLFVVTDALAASSGSCGNTVTWEYDDDGTLTIMGTGDMTNYSGSGEVPWYSIRESIESVVIENGVTSIGDYSFYYFRSLESVSIPETVNRIGEWAFASSCIPSIVIPGTVNSIGYRAFYCCDDGLKSVIIEDGVTSIGSMAFYRCQSLTDIKCLFLRRNIVYNLYL